MLKRLPQGSLSFSRAWIRPVAAVALLGLFGPGHLTSGVRADATGLFTWAFSIGGTTGGSAPGQLWYPIGVAVGPLDRIYVADTGNDRIQIFNADGSFFAGFGSAGYVDDLDPVTRLVVCRLRHFDGSGPGR